MIEVPLAEGAVLEHTLSPYPDVGERSVLPLSSEVLRSEYVLESDAIHAAGHVRQYIWREREAFDVVGDHLEALRRQSATAA